MSAATAEPTANEVDSAALNSAGAAFIPMFRMVILDLLAIMDLRKTSPTRGGLIRASPRLLLAISSNRRSESIRRHPGARTLIARARA